MRTTIDIDSPVLRQVKKLQRSSGRTLGQVVSELLARALATYGEVPKGARPAWTSARMGLPKVDLRDKEAVRRVLDGDHDT